MNTSADDALRDEAFRYAKTAVALDNNHPFAISTLGRVYVYLWFKRSEEAIPLCRKAVAMDPNNSELQLRLSMALSFSGEGEESFYLIEKALALNPLSSPIYQ
ncbi:hypothetical protein F6R98_17655 [Candidatus Methylospira mobilis]|uniref:Tetratricopeptide repeat protein n=1 Tax=Candidatus Methylospira mobilis TaxID=1808979 RepID=A0A5Q0BM66_9GAMM|nr:hypothetical protein [Candidatus Methylospira mobilis]QFY44232.1 hypothetical protein F6R98_17655 [Candidatus Methylospira mobilis]WNV06341.1 hypothetical protein RP726_08020 [Candidatus Methylospira mobilis]